MIRGAYWPRNSRLSNTVTTVFGNFLGNLQDQECTAQIPRHNPVTRFLLPITSPYRVFSCSTVYVEDCAVTVLWYLSWYLLGVLSGIHDIFRGIPLFYSANTHLFGFATTPVPTQFPRDATGIFASFASSSSLQCPRLSAVGRGCRLCNSTCTCVCVPVLPDASV